MNKGFTATWAECLQWSVWLSFYSEEEGRGHTKEDHGKAKVIHCKLAGKLDRQGT